MACTKSSLVYQLLEFSALYHVSISCLISHINSCHPQWLGVGPVIFLTSHIRELGHRKDEWHTQRHTMRKWRSLASNSGSHEPGPPGPSLPDVHLPWWLRAGALKPEHLRVTWQACGNPPAEWFLIQQIWDGGWGQEFAFVTTLNVMLILLAWGPHFKSHRLMRLQSLRWSHRKLVWGPGLPTPR